MASERRSILHPRPITVVHVARKVQQHGEAGCAFDQCADSRTAKPQDQVPFPMSGYGPVVRFGWTLTDHDLWGDKAFAAPANTRPWNAQYPARSQTGGQLGPQGSSALHEQSLVDSFVADAHGLIVGEVDR